MTGTVYTLLSLCFPLFFFVLAYRFLSFFGGRPRYKRTGSRMRMSRVSVSLARSCRSPLVTFSCLLLVAKVERELNKVEERKSKKPTHILSHTHTHTHTHRTATIKQTGKQARTVLTHLSTDKTNSAVPRASSEAVMHKAGRSYGH